jgi:hypothetical protein
VDSGMIAAWIFGLLLLTIYFLPSGVAAHRKCKAANGIVVVNLFLGWTFVGWVVALAWAASGAVKSPEEIALESHSLIKVERKEPPRPVGGIDEVHG